MEFKCYPSWDDLPPSVDSLFEHCQHESLFLSREWFKTLHTHHFDSKQSLLLACVINNDTLFALLPLIKSADHGDAFNHRYTGIYSLLLAKDKQTEAVNCLAQGLNQIPLTSLSLNPVAKNDPKLQLLQHALQPFGYEYQQYFFFYNWVHHTQQQSYDDYMAARPSQLRNTIKRKQRKLEREHAYTIRLFKGDEVQAGLADYHTVHAASWKADEKHNGLIDAMAVNFSVPDWTRLAILYVDGKAIAAQLWFVAHAKASIFRLAYDQSWQKYSPGSILTTYLMHHVMTIDKVEEIDFLMGNDTYKQGWMSVRQERWRGLFIKKAKPQDSQSVTKLFKTMLKKVSG